jgi:hypothetical protein
MDNFKEFILQNKEGLFAAARENTTYNKDGDAVITKDDPWRNETEWDESYKKLVTNKEDC